MTRQHTRTYVAYLLTRQRRYEKYGSVRDSGKAKIFMFKITKNLSYRDEYLVWVLQGSIVWVNMLVKDKALHANKNEKQE